MCFRLKDGGCLFSFREAGDKMSKVAAITPRSKTTTTHSSPLSVGDKRLLLLLCRQNTSTERKPGLVMNLFFRFSCCCIPLEVFDGGCGKKSLLSPSALRGNPLIFRHGGNREPLKRRTSSLGHEMWTTNGGSSYSP